MNGRHREIHFLVWLSVFPYEYKKVQRIVFTIIFPKENSIFI